MFISQFRSLNTSFFLNTSSIHLDYAFFRHHHTIFVFLYCYWCWESAFAGSFLFYSFRLIFSNTSLAVYLQVFQRDGCDKIIKVGRRNYGFVATSLSFFCDKIIKFAPCRFWGLSFAHADYANFHAVRLTHIIFSRFTLIFYLAYIRKQFR